MTGNGESKVRKFLTGCLAAAALVGVYGFATIGVSSLLMTGTDISAQAKGGHGMAVTVMAVTVMAVTVTAVTVMAVTVTAVTDMAATVMAVMDMAVTDMDMAISGTAIGGATVKARAGVGRRQAMSGFATKSS